MSDIDTNNAGEIEEDIKHNRVGGLIQVENYKDSKINLSGWQLTKLLDDLLLVSFADGDESSVNKGGIYIPTDASQHVWRIGKVEVAGSGTKMVKVGDYVMFPNDRGLQASNINGMKRCVFLNEARIFGIVNKE